MSALFRIVHDPHPPLPQCSQPLTEFLMLCFKKDTAIRPTAMRLKTHHWLTAPKTETEVGFYQRKYTQELVFAFALEFA